MSKYSNKIILLALSTLIEINSCINVTNKKLSIYPFYNETF